MAASLPVPGGEALFIYCAFLYPEFEREVVKMSKNVNSKLSPKQEKVLELLSVEALSQSEAAHIFSVRSFAQFLFFFMAQLFATFDCS